MGMRDGTCILCGDDFKEFEGHVLDDGPVHMTEGYCISVLSKRVEQLETEMHSYELSWTSVPRTAIISMSRRGALHEQGWAEQVHTPQSARPMDRAGFDVLEPLIYAIMEVRGTKGKSERNSLLMRAIECYNSHPPPLGFLSVPRSSDKPKGGFHIGVALCGIGFVIGRLLGR